MNLKAVMVYALISTFMLACSDDEDLPLICSGGTLDVSTGSAFETISAHISNKNITISGSEIFPSNKIALCPSASNNTTQDEMLFSSNGCDELSIKNVIISVKYNKILDKLQIKSGNISASYNCYDKNKKTPSSKN